MNFAANFTAIDFETATHRSDSACQLAGVVVRDGVVVDSKVWLIRPKPFLFSPANIQIHGISPEQVRDQPDFGERWPEVAKFLRIHSSDRPGAEPECLVAHNASFDMGVLMGCLHTHQIPIPDIQYTCTRAIARQVWPERPRFGLKPLADWLGLRFHHHDALEDSRVCAQILLAAGIQAGVATLEELEQSVKLSRGVAGGWGKRGPAKSHFRKPNPHRAAASSHGGPARLPTLSRQGNAQRRPDSVAIDSALGTPGRDPNGASQAPSMDLQRLFVRAEFIRPLAGKTVVFTGKFEHLSREDAESLAKRLGGTCQSTVTAKTNLLVVGKTDRKTTHVERSISVKEEVARDLQAGGGAIRIIGEHDFLGFVVAPS
ncbi:DNA polymerase III PolC-type [Novipirellula galeiformis]|uniref:DNA polymerase III PolC-type n=1 Tax=Novipirellula galeiformis TaxID=2528004 RepID=A0A5C6CF09_9BACT|nr:exonuclease domain-containing protein [Novipirellula galeiformis]TWU22011.1 DNA polymerase III PolC-type [Novipirellula galeiformis]